MPREPDSTARRRRPLWRRRIVMYPAVLLLLSIVFWITGCMEKMFYQPTAGPTPLPSGFPDAEAVVFQSADGTTLHGWFIPARHGTAREATDATTPAPTILHVHGNAGNITSHLYFTEYLPERGFNLFLFDYRGYGQSEGSAWRRNALIADTHAALDALLMRPDVDVDRIGMYGQSLGGGIGLNVMAERPEIRAAVIESAFTSWRRIAANVVGGDPPGPIARGLAAVLIKDHARPLDAIASVDRPLLLVHGDADSIIPVSHSRALAQAAGDGCELIIYPGGDHNSLQDTHPELRGEVVSFFRRHLSNERPPVDDGP